MRKLIWIAGFLACQFLTIAQEKGKITGKILDKKTNEPLLGVNIVSTPELGTVTDLEGNYTLEMPPGEHKITVSYLGYQNMIHRVVLKAGDVKTFNFNLEESAQELDIVTVSGSKYARKLSEETVSIEVLKSDFLENSNVITLNDGMDKASGVVMVDNQINIRSGSGFSFGVGSRVQMVYDDIPNLSVDRNEIRWNAIPIEIVEQVEVLKSASSALYGASALNGVVNVRTGYGGEKPETEILTYTQFYNKPKRDVLHWWKDNALNYPIRYGGHIAHKQRIGQNDIVISANYNKTIGYVRLANTGHQRITMKLRHHFKNVEGLTAGVGLNLMESQEADYLFWKKDSLLIPSGSSDPRTRGTLTLSDRRTVYVDPWVKYISKNGATHTLRNRFHYSNFRFNKDNPQTWQIYTEYQYNKTFWKMLNFTGGMVVQSFWIKNPKVLGVRNIQNLAPYFQVDLKLFNKLDVIVGARLEHFKLDSIKAETQPVGTIGLNYHAAKSTWIRYNISQGFRFPSLSERFAFADNADPILVLPNPNLKPERGFNTELGFKQAIKISNWLAYADLAFFWMEYWNMIEFNFDFFPNQGLGFRSSNVSRARIAGYEFTLVGSGKIGNTAVRIQSGYTYTYGADLNVDSSMHNIGRFTKFFFKSIGTQLDQLKGRDDTIISQAMLKYRYRHLFKFDFEFDYKRFTFGTETRYYGFVEKVDDIFLVVIPDIQEFRERKNNGSVIFNQRVSYNIGRYGKISLIVNNVLNKEYSIRVARLEPPRSYTIQYKINF